MGWRSGCAFLVFAVACGPAGSGPSANPAAGSAGASETSGVAASSATQGTTDDGTVLSATAALGSLTCDSGEGTATLAGTVSTTGSVDSVEITAAVDGSAPASVGTTQPQDFVHDGRDKTASYSVALTLANGDHSVVLCFTQSGAQGREPKQVCANPISISVECEESCQDALPYGDIVGNPDLCRGNGPPHVPIHVKGDFGEAPALSISGPNGYGYSAEMNHAGDSCVYQYNWDTDGNGGAGTYSFTVTGNDRTLSFSADLVCR